MFVIQAHSSSVRAVLGFRSGPSPTETLRCGARASSKVYLHCEELRWIEVPAPALQMTTARNTKWTFREVESKKANL